MRLPPLCARPNPYPQSAQCFAASFTKTTGVGVPPRCCIVRGFFSTGRRRPSASGASRRASHDPLPLPSYPASAGSFNWLDNFGRWEKPFAAGWTLPAAGLPRSARLRAPTKKAGGYVVWLSPRQVSRPCERELHAGQGVRRGGGLCRRRPSTGGWRRACISGWWRETGGRGVPGWRGGRRRRRAGEWRRRGGASAGGGPS